MIDACDPGLTGAFAAYSPAGLEVWSMPTFKQAAGKLGRDRPFPDEPAIVEHLRMRRMLGGEILLIEQVGGIPGQAAHGAFTFGHGAGFISGAAMALGFRVERVSPMRWKSALKVPANKRRAIARASELFPEHYHLWSLMKDDGKAEAAMLALYGWQTMGELDDRR